MPGAGQYPRWHDRTRCLYRRACGLRKVTGKPVIIYGDFAVSPGPERKAVPPTIANKGRRSLIFDYSVVIPGIASDFTNTLCRRRQADCRSAAELRPVRGRDDGRRRGARERVQRANRCMTR